MCYKALHIIYLLNTLQNDNFSIPTHILKSPESCCNGALSKVDSHAKVFIPEPLFEAYGQ